MYGVSPQVGGWNRVCLARQGTLTMSFSSALGHGAHGGGHRELVVARKARLSSRGTSANLPPDGVSRAIAHNSPVGGLDCAG